jgi:O-antigen ligase
MGSGLGATQAWFYGGGYRELMAEHSEYVHLLADTGAVGLGLYLAMVGSCVVTVWRVYRTTTHRLTRYLGVTALCMFPAFMFCMAFDNVLNYALPVGQYPFAFTGAVIGLSRAQRREWERIDAQQRKTPAGDPPPPETPHGGASVHPTYPLK